jgi:hypothetical protein
MKITSAPLGAPQRAAGAPAGASKKGGFAVSQSGAAPASAATARTAAGAGVGSLDALLALQELEGPLERRRRSVRRANRILDELDGVKLALLGGDEAAPEALSKLAQAVGDERAATDDPALEGVLNEVEVRAAVEMAKRERRGGRPRASQSTGS